MPTEVYEVVAQAARYWFLFLMVLIVWRSYRWYRRDQKQRKKRLKLLPDAGYVGELVLISGEGELKRGTVFLVPWEGTLGFLRSNDICIPMKGIAKKHLWFRFDNGRGLMVEALGGCQLKVDNEEKTSAKKAQYMAHGSRLYVGGAELRLRLFAGFEAPARSTQGQAVREEYSAQQEENPQGMPDAAAAQQYAVMQQIMMQQQMMNQVAQQQYAQQQAQQMAYQQQAYQQWLAQQQAAGAQEQNDAPYLQDEKGGLYADAKAGGEVDFSAYQRPPSEMTQEELVAQIAREYDQSEDQGDIVFDSEERFFPPVKGDDDNWNYAPYPQSDVVLEDSGYTYPEFVEPEDYDEDMTDAAAPPKSVYVGHDDAEQAKKKLWDKYLGGGQKR